MKVEIRQWKPIFPKNKDGLMTFSMITIGHRRAGKTNTMQHWILSYWRKAYDIILVFTIDSGVKEYRKVLPNNKHIYTEFKISKIEKIKKYNETHEKKLNTLIIFDDTGSKQQKRDDYILDLYLKSRHWNISVVYNIQTPKLVDDDWKENTNLILVYGANTAKIREKIVEDILNGFFNKMRFEKSIYERKFYRDLYAKITEKPYRGVLMDFDNGEIHKYTSPLLKEKKN